MKLVLIEWVDSHSGRGWQDRSRIEECAQLLRCKSVGWIVSETKEVIVIVPHVSGGDTMLQGLGDLVIPKCAITKRRYLD
jgi:hypothetical protein